jgi:hypothetical protein
MATERGPRLDAAPSAWLAPLLALGLAGLAVLGPVPERDNSIDTLLETEGDASDAYRRLRDRFGGDDLIVVELQAEERPAVLDALGRVHRTLARASQPVLTASVAYPDLLEYLADDALGGPDEWPRLSERLRGPLNRELGLLAPDGRSARLFGFLMASQTEARMAALDELRREQRALAGHGVAMLLGGGAVLNEALDRQSRRIEAYALPLAAAACALVLWLSLRSLVAVLLLLAPIGLTVLAVDRAYGLLGGTSNLMSVASRPITVAVLLASAIHLVFAWMDRRQAGDSAAEAARQAVRQKRAAIGLALFTTAVGFASLGLSALAPIQQFGLLTAGGLGVGWAVILLVIPWLLARLGLRTVGQGPRSSGWARVAEAVVRWSIARPFPIVAVAFALTGAGIASYGDLSIETHAIRYFDPDSKLREQHEQLERGGLGLQSIEVVATATDGWTRQTSSEGRYRALDAFGAEVRALPDILNRVDLPLLFREAEFRSSRRDVFPNPLLFSEILAQPPAAMQRFWSSDDRSTRSSFLIASVEAHVLRQRIDEIRLLGQRFLEPVGLSVEVTGNHSLILEAQTSLLDTLTRSLGWTAGIMSIVVLFVLGVRGLGWAAVLPNVLPVAMTFLSMRLLGVPLDLGTSMVAALALGIAVDDTLHFGFACRSRSVLDAAQVAGRGIVLSSLTVAAGFATLMVSDFGPTMNFGGLTTLAMVWALGGDLMVLPALIHLTRRSDPGR